MSQISAVMLGQIRQQVKRSEEDGKCIVLLANTSSQPMHHT